MEGAVRQQIFGKIIFPHGIILIIIILANVFYYNLLGIMAYNVLTVSFIRAFGSTQQMRKRPRYGTGPISPGVPAKTFRRMFKSDHYCGADV
jgi:hypothetical protein